MITTAIGVLDALGDILLLFAILLLGRVAQKLGWAPRKGHASWAAGPL